MYYQQMGCEHPMNGIFDDLLAAGKKIEQDFRHEGGFTNLVQDQGTKLLTDLTLDFVKRPTVQQQAMESAERAALTQAVGTLQQQRQQLMADIQSLTTSPAQFIKANPMKAILYFGIPAAAVYFLVRK